MPYAAPVPSRRGRAGLRVAVDLTAIETPDAQLARTGMPVRFVEALAQHAPTVEFVVLARPRLHAGLSDLDAPNLRRVAVPAWRSRLQAAARRLVGRRLPRLMAVRRRLAAAILRRRAAPAWRSWRAAAPDQAASGPAPADSGSARARSTWPGRLRAALGLDVLARVGADVVFCPFVPPGFETPSVPLVAAIDDVQHLRQPHLLSSAERAVRARGLAVVSRRATRIVCSAQSVRDALLSDHHASQAQLTLALPGPLLALPATSYARSPAAGSALAAFGLEPDRFYLLVGDVEPRHNQRLVLTAWAMLSARLTGAAPRLVLVGGPDAAATRLADTAARMGLGASVLCTGRLPVDRRDALIAGCRALIVASLYETVGDSLLVGLQLGRPVLCSSIPDLAELAELAGGDARWFDPHRPAELAALLERCEAQGAPPAEGASPSEATAAAHTPRLAGLTDPSRVAAAYVGILSAARHACPASR